ncbi:hypothetical protein HHK36_014150 [Tetracentron sinense]|uniref:K Homology domain-containing protein n=1 Tax=Tetracentron sinense TaxID=13715 RepID=A0A835DHF8_TETSI|nr:hypothetical protein HHK36_014150 [Tetracentron sinense]
MIACRSVIRIDRVWNVGNISYVLPKPIDYFQGCYAYHGLSYVRKMGGAKDRQSAMDRNKKQKTVIPVWRPVCTQSSSYEGCLVKGVMIEPGNPYEKIDCDEVLEVGGRVQEVQCSSSGHVSAVQNVNKEGETVSELDNSLDAEENILSFGETKKYSISVEVASSLIRFVKGKGGSTQKQIEGEMGVKIIIPSSKKESSIIIEGDSIESVTKASEKLHFILEEAVKSPNLDYSHFVSLPLAIHPGLVDKLVKFQNSILGNCDSNQDEDLDSDSNGDTSDDGEDKGHQLDRGLDVAVKFKVEYDSEHAKLEINKKIPLKSYPPKASKSSTFTDLGIDKSIFIKPKTFHLTVLMLKLWNKELIAAATEVLQGVSSKVMDALDNRPVSIRLKGLECMRGSLAKARVLYAPVEEIGSEDRLLRACQVITDAYVEAGLVLEKDAQQKLKLHATVMNARHRKRKKRMKKYDSFDARGIVKQYGSEEWGEYLIREAHLSQRFVFDDRGYYHCCASISFPENMQVE